MSSIFTYDCSDGTYLEIGLDLTDKKYEFSGLRLEESLFGKIPDIQLRFRTDDELCKVGDSIYCKITNPAKNDHGSRSWKFDFYVYEVTLDENGATDQSDEKVNNEVHNDLKLIENIDNNMKKPLTSHQE